MLMIYNEQVAAAIEAMELKTPTKVSKKSLDPFIIDDKELSHSPKSVTDEEDMVELRKRFVGDIDLPESELTLFIYTSQLIYIFRATGQEPLLMESKRRFVLFPIQYHEVCDTSVLDLELH